MFLHERCPFSPRRKNQRQRSKSLANRSQFSVSFSFRYFSATGNAERRTSVLTRTIWKPQESPRAAPTRGSTNGRCRTSAKTHEAGRTACNDCAAWWRTWASSTPLLRVMFSPFFFSFQLSADGHRPQRFKSCLNSALVTGHPTPICAQTVDARNGMPRCFNSARAWSSEVALVTTVIFMPFSFSIFE
jgi:hypothetical protein